VPLLTATGIIGVLLARSASHHLSGHIVEAGTLLAIAYVIFRPLAAPRSLPDPGARATAAELVRRHGSDTLSFFKLRGDKQYFFSADRQAFVGYRVENGVLLLSGDPVGPPAAFRSLLQELKGFSEARALRLGAVGGASSSARCTRSSACARSTSATRRSSSSTSSASRGGRSARSASR
jgi:lysylphosphatidylglycerol synthetase-like protein (DUF2156 family)